jgi:hypothetical protein
MQPWDSWIKDSTSKNGLSSVSDGIKKMTISGNTNGAYRPTPPNITPIGGRNPKKDLSWFETNMPPTDFGY